MKAIFALMLIAILSLASFPLASGQTYKAKLILDLLPSEIQAGSTVTFSGRLITSDGQYVIPGRTIYIKDDVDFGTDTILGSVVTDNNGEYLVTWIAQPRESGSYDFYAVFEGDDYVNKARSLTYSVHVYNSQNSNQAPAPSPNYYPTKIILDAIPSSIYAGQSITFTGQLLSDGGPVQNAVVKINEDDPFLPDATLSSGVTDSNGMFRISWQVLKSSVETDFDIYALFEGDSNYLQARSPNQILSVLRFTGSIALDPIPQSAKIGDVLVFKGSLKFTQGSSEGAVVYIKDEDPLNADDLLATAYVGRDGRFSANWFVTEVDADGEADIYAVFEGNEEYYRLTTCDPNPTMDYGGSCIHTIPLVTIYDPALPTNPTSPPSSNQYIDLFYSLDFSSKPRVAIVPSPDSYNMASKYIVPTQEGILMWQSYLGSKYGGNWDVEFEVVTADTIFFNSRPDIIVNLVTPEQESGCRSDFYGVAWISAQPQKPIQTSVCVVFGNNMAMHPSEVSATAAHEFIHAVGLGHTWNKKGDLMCSVEWINGAQVPTCPTPLTGKSKTPSELNLGGVVKLYGQDGFKSPNNKVTYKSKYALDQTGSFIQSKTNTTADTDNDGIPDGRDKCKTRPETYNGYKDTDGCPDRKP